MSKTNAENQQAHRHRRMERVNEMLDHLMGDVDVFEEVKDDGKRYITVDMGVGTRQAIDLILATKGTTFDEWLKEAMQRQLKEAAMLRNLKVKHQGRMK